MLFLIFTMWSWQFHKMSDCSNFGQTPFMKTMQTFLGTIGFFFFLVCSSYVIRGMHCNARKQPLSVWRTSQSCWKNISHKTNSIVCNEVSLNKHTVTVQYNSIVFPLIHWYLVNKCTQLHWTSLRSLHVKRTTCNRHFYTGDPTSLRIQSLN